MLTRRGFAGAALATAAGPLSRASLAANPDVIGAGIADRRAYPYRIEHVRLSARSWCGVVRSGGARGLDFELARVAGAWTSGQRAGREALVALR